MENIIIICYLPFVFLGVVASVIIFPAWVGGYNLACQIEEQGECEIDMAYKMSYQISFAAEKNFPTQTAVVVETNQIVVRGEGVNLNTNYKCSSQSKQCSGTIHRRNSVASQWDIQVLRWAGREGWRVFRELGFFMLYNPSGECELVTKNKWALVGFLYETCGFASSL